MPSNWSTANVVFRDLDLNFQGQAFQTFISPEGVELAYINARHDFYRGWYLLQNGVTVSVAFGELDLNENCVHLQ